MTLAFPKLEWYTYVSSGLFSVTFLQQGVVQFSKRSVHYYFEKRCRVQANATMSQAARGNGGPLITPERVSA